MDSWAALVLGESSRVHLSHAKSSGANKRVQPTLGNPRAADAWRQAAK